jgi:pheromone shutdown protein TraB
MACDLQPVELSALASTFAGTQVHVLGIVHDALSNFHDIARVVEAVHPDVVTLECLPSVVRPDTLLVHINQFPC